MMIDFAIAVERAENVIPTDAIYQACLLRFRPILDDDYGGIARERSRWRSAPGLGLNSGGRWELPLLEG